MSVRDASTRPNFSSSGLYLSCFPISVRRTSPIFNLSDTPNCLFALTFVRASGFVWCPSAYILYAALLSPAIIPFIYVSPSPFLPLTVFSSMSPKNNNSCCWGVSVLASLFLPTLSIQSCGSTYLFSLVTAGAIELSKN